MFEVFLGCRFSSVLSFKRLIHRLSYINRCHANSNDYIWFNMQLVRQWNVSLNYCAKASYLKFGCNHSRCWCGNPDQTFFPASVICAHSSFKGQRNSASQADSFRCGLYEHRTFGSTSFAPILGVSFWIDELDKIIGNELK